MSCARAIALTVRASSERQLQVIYQSARFSSGCNTIGQYPSLGLGHSDRLWERLQLRFRSAATGHETTFAVMAGHVIFNFRTGHILSELIRTGRSDTLDVTPYRLERFATGDLIHDPQI